MTAGCRGGQPPAGRPGSFDGSFAASRRNRDFGIAGMTVRLPAVKADEILRSLTTMPR